MLKPITLSGFRIKKNYEDSAFQHLYEKLFCGNSASLSESEKLQLLKWAVFFFNRGDDGVKRLGYRIIVRYANEFKDYKPLYDIAINAGFIPVAKFIEREYLNDNDIDRSFLRNFLSAYKTFFKDGNKYLSVEQKRLLDFSKSIIADSLVVAPTSYGKSEMMISKVEDNLDKKICIIVPSKALLAQTKRRLLESQPITTTAKRILTHPEMFQHGEKADKFFISTLTQERLFRLIQKDPQFSLDVLLIDEAHNLLSGDERGALLLQVLLVLKHRNPNMELKFYTPFIASAKSLESPYSKYELKSAHAKEFIKIEKYFVYDAKGTKDLSFYDQFMDRNTIIEENVPLTEFEFIKAHKAEKNIIYLNKPRDVESAAVKLCNTSPDIEMSGDESGIFNDSYKAIAEFLHPDYKLLGCLKKGIIYHHGRMPEIIRLYIESLFSENAKFSFVVTSSTLLEGVNIPAEKMFLLSTKRGRSMLSRASFKNLTGRVCRFSEIFSEKTGNLRMLEPEIYLIHGEYATKKPPHDFLSDQAKIKSEDRDEVENLLLKKSPENEDELEKIRAALEYIENIQEGAIDKALQENGFDKIRYVTSDIAKTCFKNNIHDFDIHLNEATLLLNHQSFINKEAVGDVNTLLETIYRIFIKDVQLKEENGEFARLEHGAARKFYAMLLDWKMNGTSYNQMIHSFLHYWKELEEKARPHEQIPVYVGSSWGEITRFENEHLPRYIDLRKKDNKQRVNIAIVKIKEEQDFIDYNLMKYIDALNDLDLIEGPFYDRIKYGSSDQKVICLLKNGISMELSKCLLSGAYNDFLTFNLANDEVYIQKAAINAMAKNNENKILIFELQFHAV
ncbi:DEAD/DEAH box helicase [Micavibrio aeruginosavorus]|uniref:Helicase conserved C-terminal domain protein n=1 Tax=Micavibrio aeruginosavorus (strain ARL-13) TaxID=856793 RepID=G2KNQ7_MICAA|nr:DEAD/DEAH box helicase [Micavibrio aeruginosavorus]AEP10302.1 helicase conserved C-terminal domain protein [Micavibrio aeruginosavorus ARL-13]